MTREWRRAVLLVLAVATLGGCLNLSRRYAEKTYFVLDAERPSTSEAGVADASDAAEGRRSSTLAVRPFRVAPGFESRKLVYRTGEMSFESDFYNEYFLPAGAQVTQATRDWLGRAGLFSGVLGEGSLVDADYVLEGSLRALHGDFSGGGGPTAVVALQVFLLRNSDRGAEILLQKDFEARESISSRAPEDLVIGLGDGLSAILSDLERAIRDLP